MSGNENVLAAGTEIVDPAAGHVVVNQELALIRPALCIFGRFRMPRLPRGKLHIKSTPQIETEIAIFTLFHHQFVRAATKKKAANLSIFARNLVDQ